MIIVWENRIDDRFDVRVVRTGDTGYTGELQVDDGNTKVKLLRTNVTLSYAARFGPDVADVAQWSEWALEAVDHYIYDEQSGANDIGFVT